MVSIPECPYCLGENDICGTRCENCQEAMCLEYGPGPRACTCICAECPCDCRACLDQRRDLRDDLLHQLSKEG